MKNREIDKSEIAVGIAMKFIKKSFSNKEFTIITNELFKIQSKYINIKEEEVASFEELQERLSRINEKTVYQKKRGVYYTPMDIVSYIVINSIKLWNKKLTPSNLHVKNLNGVSYYKTCFKCKFFDPTCGLGEFFLSILDIKFDLLEMHKKNITKKDVFQIVDTLFGNDINNESIVIAKIRIIMKLLERFEPSYIIGIADVLNINFQTYDYVENIENEKNKYDVIIGNPPYVEDRHSNLKIKKKFGNIYANVLDNSAKILENEGVMGFIIPLSYVSTPRMAPIRQIMFEQFNQNYILSFSDRPDSLFRSVHQKLCVCFFGNNDNSKGLYTSSYNYWYKYERDVLFERVKAVKNNYNCSNYIPKLGDRDSISIYKKIIDNNYSLLDKLYEKEGKKIYLNMRATFWIKVFDYQQTSSEYKEYTCSFDDADFIYCLLNSSLFWWYWVCISDCWHITQKELRTFFIPTKYYNYRFKKLSKKLREELELTKVYVGTKQTEFEYKHKECIKIISEIDDVINKIYKLTEKESKYIKNFALRFRLGGDIK